MDELYWAGPEDSQRAYSVSSHGFPAAGGQEGGGVITFADVTDLISALAAKDDFVATVSHELKNPLASVLGYLDLMAATPEIPEKAQSLVGSMGRGAQRMLRVVDDLLLFSRVGDPEQAAAQERVNVNDLVAEELELMAVAAANKSITIDTDLPESPVFVLGDADNFGRVIGNLLSNAVKYTPEGGTATISCRRAMLRKR